jgi:predicted GIY-YIG superfamily endonuclease
LFYGLGLHSSRVIWPALHGSAVDFNARFAQHLRGHTATTKRLGETLEVVAKKEVPTLAQARALERVLKRKKNPQLAIFYLTR